MVKAKQRRADLNWEGMSKGWIPGNSDYPFGTYRPPRPLGVTHRPAPQWRGLAKKFYITQKLPLPREDYDITDRVFHAAMNLSPHWNSCTTSEIEELLDELDAYTKEVDVVRILRLDRCLHMALVVLYNQHAHIRARAAELVTTMVQVNPTDNQPLIIHGNGLQLLLYNLTVDPDVTSRTKAVAAVSAILRNNKPGIAEFRKEGGYEILRHTLKHTLSHKSRGALSFVTLRRDCLSLISSLLHDNNSDCDIVTELGFPSIMMQLASSDDAEVREASLRGLLVLARNEEGGNPIQLVKNDVNLKQVLQERIEGISAMAPKDLGSAREEIRLVDSLWNACYNEPSSLVEKGLLVLPDEDAPMPDVASKLFEIT